VAWEDTLLRKTALAVHKNCLALIQAYAGIAPLWQRVLLATYVTVGPPVAYWFGGNTRTLWQQADSLIGDLFAASAMSPQEIARALQEYVKVKRGEEDHLACAKARTRIYDQTFYPLVTHFTLAFQPSAVARVRFVQRAIAKLPFGPATVAHLGCGSGAILCEVLKLRTDWTGVGMDISAAATAYAKRLSNHKGVADRAQFLTGSLAELPYANESLDIIIASEVIEHLPQPRKVLRELTRVLSPAGMLLITMPLESHSPAHLHTLNNAAELCDLCAAEGLFVRSVESRWHLSFGDDRRHIFAVVQPVAASEIAARRGYSLTPPEISSAASRGMVSS